MAEIRGVTIQATQPQPVVVSEEGEKIGFVGTAPVHKLPSGDASIEELKQVKSEADLASNFGEWERGFSIPEFYRILQFYSVKEAYIVNIFNPDTHTGTTQGAYTLDDNAEVTFNKVISGTNIAVEGVTSTSETTITWSSSQYDTGNPYIDNVVLQDTGKTTTYIEGKDYTISGGVITATSYGDIDTNNDALLSYDAPDGVALTAGTDYTVTREDVIDPDTDSPYNTPYTYENITLSFSSLSAGAKAWIAYDHASPKFVTASDIVGAVANDGTRTGMELLDENLSFFGFELTQLAADLDTESAVVTALETKANDLRAQAHVTAKPMAFTDELVAGRSSSSGVYVDNVFTSDPRVILYADHIYNQAPDNNTILQPLGWHGIAARKRRTDRLGFWWSYSSSPIEGITRPEILRTISRNDASADNNTLVDAGYVTIFRRFGSGYQFDGNYNASHPEVSDGTQFQAVQNARDTILRTLQRFAENYLDKPLTRVQTTSLTGETSDYLDNLANPERATGQAIAEGSATADIPENDESARAQGILYVLVRIGYLTPINSIVLIEETIQTSVSS
jgi:phage tail sheath protein FI